MSEITGVEQLHSSSSFHHRPASLDLIPEESSISSGYHSSPTSSLNSSIQSHHSQNVVEDAGTGGNYVASNKGLGVARVVGITPKLSQLLWDFASHDTGYYGCELFSPNLPPSSPKSDTMFSPMEGTPSDIPLLYQEGSPVSPFLKMLVRDISRDGPGQSKTSKGKNKANSVWTLRTLDGKLFVFNNGKPVSTPPDEATGGQLHHSKDSDTVIDSQQFFHCDLAMEVNPRSPPSMRNSIDGDFDPGMCIKTFPVDHSTHIFTFTSEAAAYLALDYTDAENPVLKSLPEKKLVEMLEEIKKKGKSLQDAKITPLVNIWVSIESHPNQIALFFMGDKYCYYVHVDGAKLVIVKEGKAAEKKWLDHLQFSHNYGNPPCEECIDAASIEPKDEIRGKEVPNDSDQFQMSIPNGNTTSSPVEKKLIPYEGESSDKLSSAAKEDMQGPGSESKINHDSDQHAQ